MPASASALRISAQACDDWIVVTVVGEVDYGNRRELAEHLETAIEKQAPPQVAVDLSAMGFCDCSGLRCLVTAETQARRQDGQMLVLRPSATFRKILGITGLAGSLPVAAALPR